VPWWSGGSGPRESTAAHAEGARRAPTSVGRLVEVAGIEPASFGTSPGLLRAQPAL